MIVVDLGCADWVEERSIMPLIDRFHPHILFGFDPKVRDSVTTYERTVIIQRCLAATSNDEGLTGWVEDGTRSHTVSELESSAVVGSFNLLAFLLALPLDGGPTILKLDIEGGEYELLNDLRAVGLDKQLDRILVEWHGEPMPGPWRCPVELW